jgi:DNA polymerase III alpha subunit
MAVTDHPMFLFRDRIRPFKPVPCGHVPQYVGKRVTVAGLMDCTRRTATADNKPMCFVTLEDATGLIEVVLFPPVYQRFGHLLTEGGVLLVKGRVESDLGAVTLSAEWIKAL